MLEVAWDGGDTDLLRVLDSGLNSSGAAAGVALGVAGVALGVATARD